MVVDSYECTGSHWIASLKLVEWCILSSGFCLDNVEKNKQIQISTNYTKTKCFQPSVPGVGGSVQVGGRCWKGRKSSPSCGLEIELLWHGVWRRRGPCVLPALPDCKLQLHWRWEMCPMVSLPQSKFAFYWPGRRGAGVGRDGSRLLFKCHRLLGGLVGWVT